MRDEIAETAAHLEYDTTGARTAFEAGLPPHLDFFGRFGRHFGPRTRF
jgi:hypothetical protein